MGFLDVVVELIEDWVLLAHILLLPLGDFLYFSLVDHLADFLVLKYLSFVLLLYLLLLLLFLLYRSLYWQRCPLWLLIHNSPLSLVDFIFLLIILLSIRSLLTLTCRPILLIEPSRLIWHNNTLIPLRRIRHGT